MSERRFLVFETGGTKLVAALADADARLLETRILRRNHDDRAEQSLERLIATGKELAAGVVPFDGSGRAVLPDERGVLAQLLEQRQVVRPVRPERVRVRADARRDRVHARARIARAR